MSRCAPSSLEAPVEGLKALGIAARCAHVDVPSSLARPALVVATDVPTAQGTTARNRNAAKTISWTAPCIMLVRPELRVNVPTT
jgi:hypothetical protein